MNEQLFEKYRARLLRAAVLKSTLAGAAVGFGINLIFAGIFWTLAVGGVLIGLVTGVVAGVLTGILLYLFKYKPNDLAVARRLDRTGLDERMITMLELREDDSFMASVQREDAKRRLDEVAPSRLGYGITRSKIVVSSLILLFSLTFTTLASLASVGKIPFFKDIILAGDGTVRVEYAVRGGGSILGDGEQKIKLGGDGDTVRAVASDGWIFSHWDDGERYPERREVGVRDDTVITAVFERAEDNEPNPGENSDAADDLPFGSTSNSGGGGSSDEEGGENPDSGGEGQGGGKWQDKNQFIDGATYYRDYLEVFYQYAMNIFESASDIPEEIMEFFEIYFSGL